ncbi:uncharacterized protein Dwil_GK17154 [Drosophila willistoni]|uniref:DUF4794 domain-containing protein n=1 Tax=Drosophila willistoni TaxID=7260 RepID=B4MKL1_DROWI|nr:RNA polymerase II degradation factor 1 [Drosophila willistoni]EDW72717.1 uncharacterized protein Dwil_GK17154 [Drosophila willistoni]
MFILALFCLAAVANSHPIESTAQHIVIVTPQAQVHLEPALRYVHGLSPLARVSAPHHEETIVYVPAGTAASVVPVVDAVGSGRASAIQPIQQETKQIENFPENINQIQQTAQQGVEIVSGQFGEAAAAAASTGAGFFPGFFPSSGGSKKPDEQKLKTEKIELIETPANTQPLLATEARHFYGLPQVYHAPTVVDVVHTPVYSFPISAIRARSIQAEAEPQAAPLKTELEPELPLAQPLLKEQPLEEKQPLIQQEQQQPAAIIPEANEQKSEFAGRLLEGNAIKQDLQPAELAKEQPKEEIKILPEQPLIKNLPAETAIQPEQQQQAAAQPQSQPAEIIPAIPAIAGAV